MNGAWQNQELSRYNRYILNRIIPRFTDAVFNVYELVKAAVSYKCILPSQNELVMDTYYNVSEYLLQQGFIEERKEMTAYVLTTKGIELKKCASLEKFEDLYMKKSRKSFLHNLMFKIKPGENQPETLAEYYE